MSNTSQRAVAETERALASTSFDSTYNVIGVPLTLVPRLVIIDNQTDVAVPISLDGINVWKTFAVGQALVLDLNANNGIAAGFAMDIGTHFQTNAAIGTTGSIRISILSARQP